MTVRAPPVWMEEPVLIKSVSISVSVLKAGTDLPARTVSPVLPPSSSSAAAAESVKADMLDVFWCFLFVLQTSMTAALPPVRTEASVEIWSTISTVSVTTAGRERPVTQVSVCVCLTTFTFFNTSCYLRIFSFFGQMFFSDSISD